MVKYDFTNVEGNSGLDISVQLSITLYSKMLAKVNILCVILLKSKDN